jgi:hypothetical protein
MIERDEIALNTAADGDLVEFRCQATSGGKTTGRQ